MNFAAHKSEENVRRIVGEYHGYVQSDAYICYELVAASRPNAILPVVRWPMAVASSSRWCKTARIRKRLGSWSKSKSCTTSKIGPASRPRANATSCVKTTLLASLYLLFHSDRGFCG
jgi:hypothetical protein